MNSKFKQILAMSNKEKSNKLVLTRLNQALKTKESIESTGKQVDPPTDSNSQELRTLYETSPYETM